LALNLVVESAVVVNRGPAHPAWALLQAVVIDDDPERGSALRDAAWRELAPGKPPLVFADGADGGGRLPGGSWELRQPGTGRRGRAAWAFGFGCWLYLTRSWA